MAITYQEEKPTTAPPDARPADGADEVAVEFAGWLPAFQFFGNCGHHPQFAHTEVPPAGYRFVRSAPPPRTRSRLWRVPAGLGRLVGLLFWLLGRPLVSLITSCRDFGAVNGLRALAAAFRLALTLHRAGARPWAIFRFLRSRHLRSQAMLPRRPGLLFLTSIPYTYNQHPWVIEIEDLTTLFYPLVRNGETAGAGLRDSPYFPIVKALLEDDACRGIITHMRSTADALPRLFESELIRRKTTCVPCGTSLPPAGQEHAPSEHLDLLFTCSWHQHPDSFFLRGGLEVLEAFEVLHTRYPGVRLTLRTGLPPLDARYRRIIEAGWVRVIDRFLPDDEMDALMRSTHVFLLPAARIHVVSVLRAMAYGQAVVTSDGWGFNEYVEDGRNGIIVPGRYGKTSWEDPATGMLCEDYRPTATADPAVVDGLVRAVSALVEDRALRRRLGRQARQDVALKFNLENWNRGLKQALDQATRPTA